MASTVVISNKLVQHSFKNYLEHSCRLKPATVNAYLSHMRTATRCLKKAKVLTNESIYDLTPSKLDDVITDLFDSDEFYTANANSHNHYAQALNHYLNFVDAINNIYE